MTDTPVLKAVESESEALSDVPDVADSSSAVFEVIFFSLEFFFFAFSKANESRLIRLWNGFSV